MVTLLIVLKVSTILELATQRFQITFGVHCLWFLIFDEIIPIIYFILSLISWDEIILYLGSFFYFSSKSIKFWTINPLALIALAATFSLLLAYISAYLRHVVTNLYKLLYFLSIGLLKMTSSIGNRLQIKLRVHEFLI